VVPPSGFPAAEPVLELPVLLVVEVGVAVLVVVGVFLVPDVVVMETEAPAVVLGC